MAETGERYCELIFVSFCPQQYNPEFWRIQDVDQYSYIETIKLKGPPNSEIIQSGSEFSCYATVLEEEEYWDVSEKPQVC